MSEYVDDVKCGPRRCALDVAFKGAGEPGTIKLMISSTPLGPAGAEDSMSDVTGLTSDAGPALMEQDLKGRLGGGEEGKLDFGAEENMGDVTGLTSHAGPALMEQDLKGRLGPKLGGKA